MAEPYPGYQEALDKLKAQQAELGSRYTQTQQKLRYQSGVPSIEPMTPVSHPERFGLPVTKPKAEAQGTGFGLLDTARLAQASASKFIRKAIGLEPNILGAQPERLPTVKLPEAQLADTQAAFELQAEAVNITVEAERLAWKDSILSTLPTLVAGGITDVEMLLKDFGPGEDVLTQGDIEWVTAQLDSANRAINSPEPVQVTAERKAQIIKQVTRNRSASVYGILMGSTQNLLGLMNQFAEPSLDNLEGIATTEELRAVLLDAGYNEAEVTPVLTAELDRIKQLMVNQNARYATLKTQFSQLELDQLQSQITQATVQNIVSSPLNALLLPLNYFRQNVVLPLAGAVVVGASRLPQGGSSSWLGGGTANITKWLSPSDKELASFNEAFDYAGSQDLSTWKQLSYAFENTDMNGVKKFIIETLADPLTWWGWGITKIALPLPKLGPLLYGIETGYQRGIDAAFLAIAKGAYQFVPKTAAQLVRRETRFGIDTVRAAVETISAARPGTPVRALRRIPVDEFKGALRLTVDAVKAQPEAQTLEAAAGRTIWSRSAMQVSEAEAITTRLTRLSPSAIPETLPTKGWQHVQLEQIFSETKGIGGYVSTREESASRLLSTLGINAANDSPVYLEALKLFDDAAKLMDDTVDRILDADKVDTLIFNISNKIRTNARAYQATRQNLLPDQLTALSAQVTKAGAATTSIWANHLERLSLGFARMYLMFTMYSPFNVMENGIKTLMMGHNPIFSAGQPGQYIFRTTGLLGQNPMFLERAGTTLELGPGRLIQGAKGRIGGVSTNTFKRITAQRTSAWSKLWGSMQDALIESGAKIGLHQQANVLNQSMTHRLVEMAPEVMRAIDETVERVVNISGLETHLAAQLKAELKLAATVNPQAVLDIGKNFTPAKIHAAQLRKITMNYPDLGTPTMDLLLSHIDDRSLASGLTQIFDHDVPEMLQQEVMHSPELLRQQLTKVISDLRATPATTLDDLRARIGAVSQMITSVGDVTGAQIRVTRQYAQDITQLAEKGLVYKEMWDDILIPFLNDSADLLETYIKELKTQVVSGAGRQPVKQLAAFTPDEVSRLTQLLDSDINVAAMLRTARTSQHAIETELLAERDALYSSIRAAGQNPSNSEAVKKWWKNFYFRRESSWDTFLIAMSRERARALSLADDVLGIPGGRIEQTAGRKLLVSDVSGLLDSVPEDLTRAMYLPELGTAKDKTSWVEEIYARAEAKAKAAGSANAEALGFSRTRIGEVYDEMFRQMTGNQVVQDLLAPRLRQAKALKAELSAYATRQSSVYNAKMLKQIDGLGKQVHDTLHTDPAGARLFGSDWQGVRQDALNYANEQFSLNFPNYTNETAVNALGKAIFPFWSYETHRLFWLPKTWLRTPGTFDAMVRYHDYTDQGYIRVPGTNWQMNLLRGTIWMGGMRRLILRDFPDYYDKVPGLTQAFDQLSRFGFYPNVFVGGAFAAVGYKTGGKPQWGEVVPGILQNPLEAFIAAFPNSSAAKNILELILPGRFRDYQVAQMVSKNGGDGRAILDKLYSNTPLTADEQALWNNGQRDAAMFNLANINLGLLRLKPEEKVTFERNSMLVIEEALGIPVAMQQAMKRAGMKLSDYIPVPSSVRDLVDELELAGQWRGLSSYLQESEFGSALALYRQFWTEVSTDTDRLNQEQESLDAQVRAGQINLDQWNGARKDLIQQGLNLIESKASEDKYQIHLDGKVIPIPRTVEEKTAFYSALGLDPVIMHWMDELKASYYQVKLETKYDWDTGGIIDDWDKFYSQQRAIEMVPVGKDSAAFYDSIHANDTELERFRRLDYEQYIRPYQETYDFVLDTFEASEQAIIKRFTFTNSIDEQAALREQLRPDGSKVIASFQAELSAFRQRIRQLDPEMDGRLVFWLGRQPATERAAEVWRELRQRYGFQGAEAPVP